MNRHLNAVPAAAPSRAVLYVRVSTKDQLQGDGDPDGYSIPAQRLACERRAEALGVDVAETFIERGESARSADRPELQRMLAYLAEEPVRYVIVHKVDRLARNRLDDVTITAAIQASGAQLVSVTENIDETPSGTLMHGIMSSIAEFYSRNLANEVIKGTQQKVSAGGTPHVAPIGYLNIRRVVDGRESRTVELDPERAELIKWAFQAYASGDYSLSRLAAELAERGLTQRPTPQRASRPLEANKLHQVLRNRYYIGLVTWRGVEHPGKHPIFVDAETFEQVQRVLSAHRVSGERSYRNKHYLVGTVFCDRCKSRLLFGSNTGRRGDSYEYFFCAGRHSGKTGCDLPYLPLEQLEDAVNRQWQRETFSAELTQQLRTNLVGDLARFSASQDDERGRLEERIAVVRRERYKWADKAMEGAVPADIAREKQHQLADQLLTAESALERLSRSNRDQTALLESLLALIDTCGPAYMRSDTKGRRDYNLAWFAGLDIDVDNDQRAVVVSVRRTDILTALQLSMSEDLTGLVDQEQERRRSGGPNGAELVGGSNVELLVELRGFEPLTPSLRTRCATSCATAPRTVRQHSGPQHRRPPGQGRASVADGPALEDVVELVVELQRRRVVRGRRLVCRAIGLGDLVVDVGGAVRRTDALIARERRPGGLAQIARGLRLADVGGQRHRARRPPVVDQFLLDLGSSVAVESLTTRHPGSDDALRRVEATRARRRAASGVVPAGGGLASRPRLPAQVDDEAEQHEDCGSDGVAREQPDPGAHAHSRRGDDQREEGAAAAGGEAGLGARKRRCGALALGRRRPPGARGCGLRSIEQV